MNDLGDRKEFVTMEKNIFAILTLLMCCAMLFTGCAASVQKEPAPSGDAAANHTDVTPDDDAPTADLGGQPNSAVDPSKVPEGIGGFEGMYNRRKYRLELYLIESIYSDLVDQDEFVAWVERRESIDDDVRIPEDFSLLTFIKDFNITKEQFKTAHSQRYEPAFTDEEIDVIYSDDKRLLAQTFVHPNAILVDDEIYTPYWLSCHTLDEIEDAGITLEMLEEKYQGWNTNLVGVKADIKENVAEKLEEYKAEKISAQTE